MLVPKHQNELIQN